MRSTSKGLIVGLVVVASAIGLTAQAPQSTAANPLNGTWKFNPQKSKMSNTLPPRSMTRTYTDRGNGVYIFEQELVDAGGYKTRSIYVAKEDGADYPMVIQGADSIPAAWISLKKIDQFTTEQTEKAVPAPQGGGRGAVQEGAQPRPRSIATRKISPDGRTLTLTVRTAQGGGGGDDAAAGIAAAAAARGETITREEDILVFDKQ
jgi:hypothetical protein